MSRAPEPTLDAAQTSAVELLRSAQSFVLTGHERPDGDCVGAQAALWRALTRLGKDVHVINPDPPEARYDYLASFCPYQAYAGGPLPAHDVVVYLDLSDEGRCGAVSDAIAGGSARRLVIDHHVLHGEPWWDEGFIDVSASATGLLVWRVARALDVELDREMALGIFTSLVTDTGWFRYSNTDAETMAVASELVAAGVEPNRLFDAIFQREERSQPVAISRLLGELEYHADGRLAVLALAGQDASEAIVHAGDPVLDIVRSVADVEVVVYLRELSDGTVKLSARSKTDYDVSALARTFGGGGHKKAAGATLRLTLDEAREHVVAAALERLAAGIASEDQGDG